MKLSIKAVLIGWAVDLAGSLILGLPIGIMVGVSVARGVKPEQIAARIANSPVEEIGLLLGLVMSILAGWVAANIARRHPISHGAATGLLSFASYWLINLMSGAAALSSGYDLAATLLTIPCATLGGYLRGKKRDKEIGSMHGSAAPPIPEP